MKTKRSKDFLKFLLPVFLLVSPFILGCEASSRRLEFNRAERAEKEKDYSTAAKYYLRVMKRNPEADLSMEAARRAVKLYSVDLSRYNDAVTILEFLIVREKDKARLYSYQKNLANIYFENLLDYEKAIIEYNKMLQLRESKKDKITITYNIARSYFSLNKFYQANIEVKKLLDTDLDPDTRFEILLLRGNILLTMKNHTDAIDVYTELIEEFPEKTLKEKVQINLAVCYEELNDFDRAVVILEEMRSSYPNQDFIDRKIARLKQRKQNLPGARGKVR